MARMAILIALDLPEGVSREKMAQFVRTAVVQTAAGLDAKTEAVAKFDADTHRLAVRYVGSSKTREVIEGKG